MSEPIRVIDVWTQYLSPTPLEKRTPQAENVFRRYGRLDEYYNGTNVERLIEEMDRFGIERILISGDNEKVAALTRRYPKRVYGDYHADPTDIMRAVRELEHYATECGFICLRIEPFLWRKVPTDRAYYPLYAKAVELDVTFQTQVGNTGPLYPSETGRPTYIDEVALDFPELRIVCGHIGWPWTEEMIAIAWKHANVFVDTSAHAPRYYPPAFVHFLKTFGQSKCLFASDYPVLPWDRLLTELDDLALPDDIRRKFLRTNALRAFKFPE